MPTRPLPDVFECRGVVDCSATAWAHAYDAYVKQKTKQNKYSGCTLIEISL